MFEFITKNRTKIFGFICAILAGLYVIKLIIECIYGVPSFDGAMNLQVPLNLLKKGKYMTSYDGGIMFDGKIQTRYPVLIPIYILWKLFGVSSVSALLVNAIYILLMQFFIWKVMKRLNASNVARFCAISLSVLIPCFDEFSMGIFGEIPTLALIIGSVYWLMKNENEQNNGEKYFILSGLFMSLAVLNKTVALVAMPSFIFVLIIKLIDNKKEYLKYCFTWIVAFVIPIIVEEIFHFIQMGSLENYISGWKSELLDIAQQSGVKDKYADTPNLIVKFWTHINIFCDDFNFYAGPVILILILVAVFSIWIYYFFVKKNHGYESILLLIMCSYFGWWTIITSTEMAWARRILPGAILLLVIFIFLIDRLIFAKMRRNLCRNIMFVIVSILFVYLNISFCINYDYDNKNEIVSLADEMKNIEQNEDTKFYGYGWWQAPVLAFYADITIYDLENHMNVDGGYLVVDNSTKALSNTVDEVSQKYDLSLVDSSAGNELYKINEINYKSHNFISNWNIESIDEEIVSNWQSNDDYKYINGVYDYEEANNGRWASSNVEILLNTIDKNNVAVKMYVPDNENMTDDNPRLFLYCNNELVQSVQMFNGEHEIVIDTSKYQDKKMDLRIVCNAKMNNTNGDQRDLAFIVYSIMTN